MHETFPWLADNLALNFLNTLYLKGGELTETLGSDADVRRWLAEGELLDVTEKQIKAGRLLKAARELRDDARQAIENRKKGRSVDPKALNHFLEHRHVHLRLDKSRAGELQLVTRHHACDELELLSPVAESAARLLVSANFDLVRQCEGSSCVLWFYDTTKGHRRRWCSMATCGNRRKVKTFRSRERSMAKRDGAGER